MFTWELAGPSRLRHTLTVSSPTGMCGLASEIGVAPLTPSLAGGTDYAYGGAETGVTSFNTAVPATDLLGSTGQIAQFQGTHPAADPNALYTIWIGSNDLSDILASAPTSAQAR